MRKQYKVGILLAAIWVLINTTYWLFSRQYLYVTKEEVPINVVIQKWGNSSKFDSKKFRSGTDAIRASMVADLIINKYFIGKQASQVFEDFEDSGQSFKGFLRNYKIKGPVSFFAGNTEFWIEFEENENGTVKNLFVIEYCCSNPYATYLHYKGWLKLK